MPVNEKFSQWPTNNSPAPTDNILSVQSPGSVPQDVQVPFSKAVNPVAMTNPCKFYVYRNGTLNTTSGGFQEMPMDTKVFDTGANVDVVTNIGRFTAPVAGFYWFASNISLTGMPNGGACLATLYKNGSEILRGSQMLTGGTANISVQATGLLELAANDYVEPWFFSGQILGVTVGQAVTYFQGYLVSGF